MATTPDPDRLSWLITVSVRLCSVPSWVWLLQFSGGEEEKIKQAVGTFCSNQPFALEIIKTKQKKDSRFTSFILVLTFCSHIAGKCHSTEMTFLWNLLNECSDCVIQNGWFDSGNSAEMSLKPKLHLVLLSHHLYLFKRCIFLKVVFYCFAGGRE